MGVKPLVIYIGDDLTDEDAFRAIETEEEIEAVSVLVSDERDYCIHFFALYEY